jgi:hypothetical protein
MAQSWRVGLALWILGIVIAGTGWAQVASPPIDLRDDRGESINAPLTVCFRTDLKNDCVDLPAGQPFVPPASLRSLRAEGPDHGPAAFEGGDLKAGADGFLHLHIPRKALLQVDKRPAAPLDAAVYDKGAASFEKPLVSARGVGPAGFKIPAGDLLVALSSGRKAPDLQRLSVQPGAIAHLDYHSRDGWSLVVRTRGARTGKAVGASMVSLESVPGYGAPNRPAGEGTTGADGLALFSGLSGRRIDAGIRHADFLPRTVPGLAAAPGALAFHDAALEEGGWVRARIAVKGRARQGAFCRLKEWQPPPGAGDDWTPKVLYEGRTDREGICRTARFPAETYVFEAYLAEGGATLKDFVGLQNGKQTDQDLNFSEIRARGTVTRGGEPVPGLTVTVLEHHEDPPLPVKLAQATSGRDGTYEVTLAKPGRFGFMLQPAPQAIPIVARDVAVTEEDENVVDFSLLKTSIHGKVVDERGKPVDQAVVILHWHAAANPTGQLTDARGEFELLLEAQGDGSVEAVKKGYRKSERQNVALGDETELPPLTLVLTKEKVFRGTLSSAAGLPVAGGWVSSMRSHLGDEHIDHNEGTADATGRFEVAAVGDAPNRLFASGPGCPLSFFDPIDMDGELALRCQGRPAVLDVTLVDATGHPVPGARLFLRQGNVIIPGPMLYRHLDSLGLRPETDASGRLVIPNLAPGDYDLFLGNTVEEGMIEAGSRTGYLTTARLAPLGTTVLRLTVGGR